MQLEKRFLNFITHNDLFEKDDRILVAISGGTDSSTLLHLMVSCGYNVAIAHCNFSLRGSESDGDERFVRDLQRHYQIDGYYVRFDTEREAEKAGESIQMAARRLRYDWFKHICNDEGFQYIAIAHNADDVAETFFLNLTRGTGIKGLTGIKPKTGRIVRPLLFATRQEIDCYAQQQGLDHREDSSNAKDKYARNRIRLNVVPELKHINPSFSQTMLDNIARLQMVDNLVTQEVNSFKQEAVTTLDKEIHIDIDKLRSNRNAKLLLYELLHEYGFNSTQTNGIAASIESGESGSLFEGHSYQLLRDRARLILRPIPSKEGDELYTIKAETTTISQPIKLELEQICVSETFEIERSRTIAYLDIDKIEFPLILRKWKTGDEFHPIGMSGRKKLSDYFIDQKMSIYDKEKQWLLCTGTEVAWVVGRRLDERYKVTSGTTKVLCIRICE